MPTASAERDFSSFPLFNVLLEITFQKKGCGRQRPYYNTVARNNRRIYNRGRRTQTGTDRTYAFRSKVFFLEILFAFTRQGWRPLSRRARLTGFQTNPTRSGPAESLFQLFNTLLLKKIHPKGEINKRFIYDRSGWKFLAKRTKHARKKKKSKYIYLYLTTVT